MAKIIFKILFLGLVLVVAGVYFFGARKNYLADDGAANAGEWSAAMEEAAKEGGIVVPEPITILAFGDLLLDRYIKREIDRNLPDYPFENLKEILSGNDLLLANLEGSFTDFAPRPLDPNNTSFTFSPALAPMLAQNGFDVVNLANNHAQDFGRDGFEQSQAYLSQSGIAYFGDFYNESEALIKQVNGKKIGFAGYHEFGDAEIEGTVEKIKNVRELADYVIVYTHWGNEYQNYFSKGQQEKARRFVDAGADVVLGSHPHVIQPIEIYNGKPIFYSLGNFLFDQIFSFEVRHGLGVKISLNKDKTEFELIPTEMKNFQVNLADEKTKFQILSELSKNSLVDDIIKPQITSGNFTVTPWF